MDRKIVRNLPVVMAFLLTVCATAAAQTRTTEGPNLGPFEQRVTQKEVENNLSLDAIRAAGLRLFSTPFNKYDGYGDGEYYAQEGDPRLLGNRPSLQQNNTFLRVNGLDAQTCVECHFIVRNSQIPAVFGVGGVAGANANAILMPSYIDVAEGNPGEFNGRFINPPFLFGAGGIELLAREMTAELQGLKKFAIDHPGKRVRLKSKSVDFGEIVADESGGIDPSGIQGIDADLVVRPFGRKGEFFTSRNFAVNALQFHLGIQPVEIVGDEDADGDGVSKEVLVGEVSAVHIWITSLPKPIMENPTSETLRGFALFTRIGCADCHLPNLQTDSRLLTYAYPEVATDPGTNVYLEQDLAESAGFLSDGKGGLIVSLFSDLKRHDMGDARPNPLTW